MLMKDVLDGGRPRPAGQPQPNVVLTSAAGSQATQGPTSASRRPSGPATPQPDPGTNDLLVVMTQRLRTLESQCAVLQKELREKSSKAIEFEDKYNAERATRKELEGDVRNLEAQCEENQRQLTEMHLFLSDYGLSWVGGSATSSPSTTPRSRSPANAAPKFDFLSGTFDSKATVNPLPLDQTQKPDAAVKDAKRKVPFDLEKLKHNALILTDHVGLTGLLPGAQPNMKQIKDRDMVYVAVYLDGISVNSGLFRPYGWPLCDAILDDMLEGFYPYEFREKYPDGFPITIVDKSDELCPTGHNAAKMKEGNGVRGIESLNDHGYKPLTREALLKKLPERFITANGHLVQVRGSMEQILSGGTAPVAIPSNISADTAAGRAVSESTSSQAVHGVIATNNVTALQIKLPQGHKISLHMYFHDDISAVRRELEKAAPFFKPANGYELTTAFPRMTYDDHQKTLEALGLVPNGAMMMIKLLPGPSE
ncbi:ubiquitin-regulatory protein, putative [Bodo saltans]|uniref:UBX domain-containing protein 11 n=1 Tax=Bodo saltans TaxID=75058 RepID=A0A0S4JTW8_BODSA|nr:ubiquitin-regulatory protein, putative [Bodo saltans]|eukprot:CUG93836.1 ubiquitin-regulatory protein, putative [Bodo saltans]